MNRALSFDVTDDLSYRILGRDRDIHMDMIGAYMPFQNLTLTLPCQFPYHFPKVLTDVTIQRLPATLRYPDFERFTEGRLSITPGTVKL